MNKRTHNFRKYAGFLLEKGAQVLQEEGLGT